jgi:hypothetical protein
MDIEATRRFLLKVHDLLIRATRRHPCEHFTKQKLQCKTSFEIESNDMKLASIRRCTVHWCRTLDACMVSLQPLKTTPTSQRQAYARRAGCANGRKSGIIRIHVTCILRSETSSCSGAPVAMQSWVTRKKTHIPTHKPTTAPFQSKGFFNKVVRKNQEFHHWKELFLYFPTICSK